MIENMLHYIYLAPLIQFLILLLAIPMYISAVHNGHVYPMFPYMSDAAAFAPEFCYFVHIASGTIFFMTIGQYLRYSSVKFILKSHKQLPGLSKWNRIAFCFAILAAIGFHIGSCYSVWYLPVIHLIGATLAFGGTYLSLCIQVFMSFILYPILGNWKLNVSRAVIMLCASVALILALVYGALSLIYFDGDDFRKFDYTKWSPQTGGYEYHVVSAVSEWISIYFMVFTFATYSIELKEMTIKEPELEIKIRNNICHEKKPKGKFSKEEMCEDSSQNSVWQRMNRHLKNTRSRF